MQIVPCLQSLTQSDSIVRPLFAKTLYKPVALLPSYIKPCHMLNKWPPESHDSLDC